MTTPDAPRADEAEDERATTRLRRWRDTGNDPDAGYCAGNADFGRDVIVLLAEIERLRPVVAAAVAWSRGDEWDETSRALASAVDAYEAASGGWG